MRSGEKEGGKFDSNDWSLDKLLNSLSNDVWERVFLSEEFDPEINSLDPMNNASLLFSNAPLTAKRKAVDNDDKDH